MNAVLNRNLFFIKEHVGMFKAANNFDVLDPESQELIMTCREPNLGFFTKLLRFSDYKRMTPFNIEVKTASGDTVVTIRRGVSWFRSVVEVLDQDNQLIGIFRQQIFSIGGKFNVLDAAENHVCTLKGKWTSWNFKFLKDEIELAHVSKKWSGLGKELFTSADNYMLQISDQVPANSPVRQLILAAVMCIDMVLKE